jgi:hypothetical protein
MQPKNPTPFDEITINGKEIVARPNNEPVLWSEFARQAFLTGTPITAEDLVGKTFDILRAKLFDSSFEHQDHAWYCVVRPVDQDEVFAVTLGGQAVVEILDAYAATGNDRPLRVALAYHQGGKFNGYYTFE